MPDPTAPTSRLDSLPWGDAVEADPIVTTLRIRNLRGWPKYREGGSADLIPLSNALGEIWRTDRYVAAYVAADYSIIGPRRLNKPSLLPENVAILGGLISLIILTIEADCPTKEEDPESVEAWWIDQERPKVERVLADHPGLIAYRTRGGYRIMGRFARAFELRAPADNARWVTLYQAMLSHLKRRYDISGDPRCIDWTRLQGLPRATRKGSETPEDRDALGDPDRVGTWGLTVLEESDWLEGESRASAYINGSGSRNGGLGDDDSDGEEGTEEDIQNLWKRLERAGRPTSKALGGSGRNGLMFIVACIIFNDWNLPEEQGMEVFREYNERYCSPPYEEARLVTLQQNSVAYSSGSKGSPRVDASIGRVLTSGRASPEMVQRLTAAKASTADAGVTVAVVTAPGPTSLESTIEKAIADVAEPERERSNVRLKPTIQIGNDVEYMAKRAKEILAMDPEDDLRLYQRDGRLVQLALDDRPDKNGEPIGAAIVPVEDICVIARLSTLSTWIETTEGSDKRPAKSKPVQPPTNVARRVISSRRWPVRVLAGIAECPTLRSDGSIIAATGYDEKSGLYMSPAAELRDIEIPALPSRAEAREAYALLRDVFKEFPFVKPCHGAAAVAFLLSVVLRECVKGPCPIFALKAPQSDSGKTLLVDCVSIIACGRTAPRQIYSENDDEAEKRIAATLGSGRQLCLVDNVTGRFGGQAWDGVLSAKTMDVRVFGQNTSMTTMVVRTVFCVTGNGLRVKDDMVKRTDPIEIDPQSDRPGDRIFERDDLEQHCRDNRRALVRACLVLGAAYLRRGMPGARRTTGPFRSWSQVIRGMIEWVTWEPGIPLDPRDGAERGIDPWGGQAEFGEDADTVTQADAVLVATWFEVFGSVPQTTADAFALTGPLSRTLRDAIVDAVGESANATSLGTHIGNIKNKTFGYDGQKYRWARGSDAKRDRRWRVVKL